MDGQQEYNIIISANCKSTLNKKDLENKLVASLYDIDTKEKISDGDNDKFEILDYNFTNAVVNRDSIDKFIINEIKKIISQIIINNGYDKTLFDENLFAQAIENCDFLITTYEISRIYTLAEIYFELTQKSTCYSSIIEKIVGYDVSSEE